MKFKKLLVIVGFVLGFGLYSSELTLVIDDWPPYTSLKLENQGFLVEVVRQALKESDISLVIESHPWTRNIAKSISGEYTGIIGASFNEERAKYFLFSDALIFTEIYLVSNRKLDVNVSDLDSLTGFRIGITKKYYYTDELSNKTDLRFVTSYTVEEGVEKLKNNKLDFIIADQRVLEFYSKIFNMELIYYNPPVASRNMFLIINKSVPNAQYYINTFNEGLKKLKDSGRYLKILEEYGQ